MTSASSKTSAKRHIIANGDPLMYNVRSPGTNDERLPLIKGNNLSSSQLANANYRKKLPVPPSYPPSRSKDRQAARNNVILQSNSSTYRRWKGKKHPHHQQAVLTHDRDDAVSEDGAMDPHSNEKNQSYNNTGMAVQTARHGNLPSLTQGSGEETSSPTALYPMGMPSYMSPFDKKFQHTNSSSGLAYYSNDQSMTPGGGISSSSNSTASAAVTPQYQVPLTNYEEEEIKQYSPDVFFCGTESCKKVNAVRGSSHNSGYDDDNSHYKIVVGDHIAYRYEILKELGRGTFGVVVKAMDHKRNCQVAVKLIRNNPTYTKQAKEEVHLLEVLKNGDPRDHANIVRLIDSGMFRNHYIMVFELLVMDLYIMCQQQKFKPVSMDYLLDFTEQMLTSLTYVHSNHIIHCDVKPENIVICSESSRAASNSHYRRLKLIDFGSACREDKRMFTYIQSRYYRAPEIVLGIPYTCAIDMWSFGCVLCELANGYPIFPACCEGELLERMTEYLGDFSQDLIAKGKRAHKFFLESGELKADLSKKHRQRRSPGSRSLQMFLKSAFHEKDSLFLDFVSRCLIYHPDKRMTAVEAREHPWVKSRRQQ